MTDRRLTRDDLIEFITSLRDRTNPFTRPLDWERLDGTLTMLKRSRIRDVAATPIAFENLAVAKRRDQ